MTTEGFNLSCEVTASGRTNTKEIIPRTSLSPYTISCFSFHLKTWSWVYIELECSDKYCNISVLLGQQIIQKQRASELAETEERKLCSVNWWISCWSYWEFENLAKYWILDHPFSCKCSQNYFKFLKKIVKSLKIGISNDFIWIEVKFDYVPLKWGNFQISALNKL